MYKALNLPPVHQPHGWMIQTSLRYKLTAVILLFKSKPQPTDWKLKNKKSIGNNL